jgi:L-lactate dehydrogenase complex protein LldG
METQLQSVPAQFANFKARAEAVGAKVYDAADTPELARTVAAIVLEKDQNGLVAAAYHLDNPQFAELWQALSAQNIALIIGEDAKQIVQNLVGISFADLAIAETGSVTFATNDLPARLVAMLTYYHIAVVPGSKMVDNLDALAEKLVEWQAHGDRRYVTTVTGPSRTADIERVLTIGVQGPQELHVIVKLDE